MLKVESYLLIDYKNEIKLNTNILIRIIHNTNLFHVITFQTNNNSLEVVLIMNYLFLDIY